MAASLARRRKNPGERAKLPLAQLTPAQQHERLRLQGVAKDNADPLYNPAVPLAGHTLASVAKKLVDTELNPQVSALQREGQNATTQGNALVDSAGGIYRDIAARELNSLARQRAIADMGSRQAGDVGSPSPSMDMTNLPVGEAGALGNRAAQARTQDLSSSSALGDRWVSLANLAAQARQMRGGEIQGQLLNRVANAQADNRAKITDVQSTRGGKMADLVQKLRQQGFENSVTMKGLGIKQADLMLQGQKLRTDASIKRETLRQTARQKAMDRATSKSIALINQDTTLTATDKRIAAQKVRDQWKLDHPDPLKKTGGKKGGRTAGQIASDQEFFGGVMSVAQEYDRLLRKTGSAPKTAQQLRSNKVSPLTLNAAADVANYGHILPVHARALEAAGYTIPPQLRPPKRGPRRRNP